MNWIIYTAIIYLSIGGAIFQTAFQEGRLDGKPHPRYLWLALPFWPLVFVVGKKRNP